jgi:hypothetical protein
MEVLDPNNFKPLPFATIKTMATMSRAGIIIFQRFIINGN